MNESVDAFFYESYSLCVIIRVNESPSSICLINPTFIYVIIWVNVIDYAFI